MTARALLVVSQEPQTGHEVEQILRRVPELAFHHELERFIPDRKAASSLSRDDVVAFADDAYRTELAATLADIEKAALQRSSGALAFLARTFHHFLTAEPVASDGHPLVIALALRGEAQAGRIDDTVLGIGRALDRWGDGA